MLVFNDVSVSISMGVFRGVVGWGWFMEFILGFNFLFRIYVIFVKCL